MEASFMFGPRSVSPTSPRNVRSRRRLGFSLRFLFVLVAVSAAASCWLGAELRAQRREEAALKRLAPFHSAHKWGQAVEGLPSWIEGALRKTGLLRRIVSIEIHDDKFGDDDADVIAEFSHLRALWLESSQLTGTGVLRACGRPDQLRSFGLDKVDADDAVIDELGILPRLEVLYLCLPGITGDCLPAVAKYPRLDELDLRGTSITDRSLDSLRGFSTLRRIWLDDEFVSDEAADKLARERPYIQVLKN